MEKFKDSTVLSKREVQVMERLVRGKYNKEIADDLNMKFNTVRKHLQHIFPKLKVSNRSEAIIKYMEITGKIKEEAVSGFMQEVGASSSEADRQPQEALLCNREYPKIPEENLFPLTKQAAGRKYQEPDNQIL